MNTMNIHEILKYLPHRYPLLLVDRVLSFEAGKDIVARYSTDMTSTESKIVVRT